MNKIPLLFLISLLLIFLVGGTPIYENKSVKDIESRMVMVPGGKYKLFIETEDVPESEIDAFYMDVRAVTNNEFLEFVKMHPRWRKSQVSGIYADKGYLKHWEGDLNIGNHYEKIKNSPVTNVSWHAANAYAKWKGKRLPTALEWEYAGTSNIVDDQRPLEEIIFEWYSKPTPTITPEVGSTFKNELGLYDMHGLVWEWVYDFNSIVMDGDSRSNLSRDLNLYCASGSFGVANKEDYASFMRFAFRGSLKSNYTVSNLGFRCAVDVEDFEASVN